MIHNHNNLSRLVWSDYATISGVKKEALIGGITLILLGAGLIALSRTSEPQPALAPATALPLPPGGYVERARYYDIAANYATSTPLPGSANTAAIAAMQQFVADTIIQFKKGENSVVDNRKKTLEIKYLIASSAHTVSYLFTIYEDTLGAHGNLFFRIFTFDTTSGQGLALGDLFTSGSGYLDNLSSTARAELPVAIGNGLASRQMLDQGTTPEDKNFANFFLDNGDFVALFAPYAVAPYAAGPQTLRIPLSDLSSILKPQYR